VSAIVKHACLTNIFESILCKRHLSVIQLRPSGSKGAMEGGK